MKHLFIALISLVMAAPAFAKDMSGTESYEEAYEERADGARYYIGQCTTHEDHEKNHYRKGKTIIPYIDSWKLDEMSMNDLEKLIAKLPIELWQALLKKEVPGYDKVNSPLFSTESMVREFLLGVDDITVTTIKHNLLPDEEFYQFNIGVGGGNGGYSTYMRLPDVDVKRANGLPGTIKRKAFELVSATFDGDMEFCSDKVWLPNLE